MIRFKATNKKDAENFVFECDDLKTAKNWVINHNLDLSKEWHIKKDNFVEKNKFDISYREIQDIDNQFSVMSYILDCLNDKQLKIAQKLVNEIKRKEKN